MKSHTGENLPGNGSYDKKDASGSAETAAVLERKGVFGEAARWWRLAADAARSQHQRHWCECRAGLCERYHKAPLSQPISSSEDHP